MLLEQRPPSANWEPVPLDPSGQRIVWAWFRPPALPSGLILAIPASLFADAAVMPRLSVRQLVAASGLDPMMILCWTVNAMSFDAQGGASPLLDQLLPQPTADGNLEVTIWMAPFPQPAWPGFPAQGMQMAPGATQAAFAPVGASDSDPRLLDAIDSCWNAIVILETRVSSIRKELSSSLARLNSLNRDLSSDERRTCDSRDIQDWSDARRWLRDSISVLSRSVKEIDVGTTSGAGKRNRFEEIYQTQIVPRIPFPGLMQAVNEFESYRKIIQTVLASAQASISKAGRDAEQRANSVLQRVATKMRASRR